MEESGRFNSRSSHGEYIAMTKETRGTETSKYPEEKKETSISQVAASERERGQTSSLLVGLWTHITHGFDSRIDLESSTVGGNSPVDEIK